MVIIAASLIFVVVAKPVVLPVVMALFASFLLGPPVRWMARGAIPRPLAAGVLVLTLLAVIGTGLWTQLGVAVQWVERLPQSLPEIQAKITAMRKPVEQMARIVQTVDDATSTSAAAVRVEVAQSGWPQEVAAHLQAWASALLFATILSFFVLAEGDRLPRRIANALAGPDTNRTGGYGGLGPQGLLLQQLIAESESTMSLYLLTVTWVNGLLGLAVGVSCWLLGMPNPLLWGVMAFALNYIPYFGAVIGMVIMGSVGLLSFDTVSDALAPAGAYLVLNLIEGELVTPLALRQRFSLDPVITVIWTALWLWLWGIPGGIFAVPLLVLGSTICRHVPSLRPLAEIVAR